MVEVAHHDPPPPVAPAWSPPPPPPPANENSDPPPSRVEPTVEAAGEFTDDAPPELGVEPPGAEESARDAWDQHMAGRIAQLGAFGEALAAALTGMVERNLDVCEELGSPLPKLSRRPEDAETRQVALELYRQSALYTLALLPIRPGKYTPVVVTVGGLVGSGVAAGVARRRAGGAPVENQVQPTARRPAAEEEAPEPRAPRRTRPAPRDDQGDGESAPLFGSAFAASDEAA